MSTIGHSRNTPVLSFSSLTLDELRTLMRMMRSARDQAYDNGVWIELEIIRILARSDYLIKWQENRNVVHHRAG